MLSERSDAESSASLTIGQRGQTFVLEARYTVNCSALDVPWPESLLSPAHLRKVVVDANMGMDTEMSVVRKVSLGQITMSYRATLNTLPMVDSPATSSMGLLYKRRTP
jgi:hypothetical protein